MDRLEEKSPSRARRFIGKRHKLFINGEWKEPQSGEYLSSMDPSSEEPVCEIADAGQEDVDLAVEAAREAFEKEEWRDFKPAQRRDLLIRIADKISEHTEELAYLDAREAGKVFKNVVKHETPSAAAHFRYYAGWCDKIHGTSNTVSMPGERLAFTRREPVGVAALIVPWNFPLGLTAMKAAPALAAGCACVLKPAEETSLSALRLGELMREAGAPPGVFNVVTGRGAAAGAMLAHHARVDKIAFTGSTASGRSIVRASAGNFKRVSLELGGNSPCVICADADLENAIPASVRGAFFNAGQNCVALSRMLVHADIYNDVLERVRHETERIRVGPWNDDDADIGPLISEKQLQRALGYVKTGLREGAQLVTGGFRLDRAGYFMQPTVLAGCASDMRVVREEIFGPVLTVERFTDIEDVIRKINRNEYGLFGSVWTNDVSLAQKFVRELRIGKLVLNTAAAGDSDLPLGGYRQSGWGRELGYEGLSLYLETKSVVLSEVL